MPKPIKEDIMFTYSLLKDLFFASVKPLFRLLQYSLPLVVFGGLLGYSAVSSKGAHAAVSSRGAPSDFCEIERLKRFSAKTVRDIPIPISGDPELAAKRAALVAALLAGQKLDIAWHWWLDPEVEVFPNNPSDIVTTFSDAEISAIADEILSSINPDVTFADLQSLNNESPGMGDAAENIVIASVRAYAHVLQIAAAFAQDGTGAPSVLEAAALIESDLAVYREAITEYAPFLELNSEVDSLNYTASDFLNFLSDVENNGASAVPQAEIEMGELIIQLANVHLVGITIEEVIVRDLILGDTGNEAENFPSDGYTARELLESGISALDRDPFATEIIDPDPPAFTLVSFNPDPPTSVEFEVQDAVSGLMEINVVKAQNATIDLPNFTQGTTDPVVVTATKEDASLRSIVILEACDPCRCALGDPVIATLSAEAPENFSLEQNYPNPFNSTTAIPFKLPEKVHVTLTVYDVIGRKVATLVDEEMSPGTYEVQWEAALDLSSGAYFYRFEAGPHTESRRMTLVK